MGKDHAMKMLNKGINQYVVIQFKGNSDGYGQLDMIYQNSNPANVESCNKYSK